MKHLKPITNSSRNTTLIDYKKKVVSVVKKYPRVLFTKLKKHSGRNNRGVVTMRHQGGAHKKTYRIIDFKRYPKDGVSGIVKSIEYDPYRNCFISFISYENGTNSFILSPAGLKVGDRILSGSGGGIPLRIGNNMPLEFIPAGVAIHNLELRPLKGGQLIRSAGSHAEIVGKEEGGRYTLVKLVSKEVRKILSVCRATIGRVGNEEQSLVKLGKAGRNRWRGVRPTVRGSAMNPVDHPHGGGEGKTLIGRKSPLTPWGKKTLGKKTRHLHKPSDRFIAKSRHQQRKR